MELNSACGELKGGSSGERQLGRGATTTRKDGLGERGFREMGGDASATFDHRSDQVGALCVGAEQGTCRCGGEVTGTVMRWRSREVRMGSAGFLAPDRISRAGPSPTKVEVDRCSSTGADGGRI